MQGGSGECVELVFFRLSAIDRCQARCVCRDWQRTIDDPSFRKWYARSHACIPLLCLRIAWCSSLFVKPVENSPCSGQWRHFQTLPEGMRIVSSDAGLLCLATVVEFQRPNSIFVWRYSDLNSSPVRVPLPPVVSNGTSMVVYSRERDRSTPEFCIASFNRPPRFDRPSLSMHIYDSACGEWSRRKDCPDVSATIKGKAFSPMLDHGEVVQFCPRASRIARYNVWDGSWRVFQVDANELELGLYSWCFLQLDRDRLLLVSEDMEQMGLVVAEARGGKWEAVSYSDEELRDPSLRDKLTCTDGKDSVWLVAKSRIVHYGVDSRRWSEVDAPDVLRAAPDASDVLSGARGQVELVWFSC